MKSLSAAFVSLVCIAVLLPGETVPSWPQFRGNNSTGITSGQNPPVEFGPKQNVLWRVTLPTGHSSPAIWGDRIFLTAFDTDLKKLEVIGLDRTSGRVLWRKAVPAKEFEKVNAVSSLATATPAVDADHVYAYFGSYGLLCFSHDGEQLWNYELPAAKPSQGSGTSPVVVGDQVLLFRDEAREHFLHALDRHSGEVLWRQTLPEHQGPGPKDSWATPVVVGETVVLHRSREIAAYSRNRGERIWWASLATTGTSTPVVAKDAIYVATYTPVGEPDHKSKLPSYDALLAEHDADGDGAVSKEAFPDDLYLFKRPEIRDAPGAGMSLKRVFRFFDKDKNDAVNRTEWDEFLKLYEGLGQHGMVKIRLGGEGEVTLSHLLWKENRAVPEVPSPVVVGSRVYMVKNGGILTCMDKESGKVVYRSRLGATGAYLASLIEAGGRLYAASSNGVVVVIAPGDQLDVLARNDLEESIAATPAVVDDILYVRTERGLYAFSR